MWYFVAFQKAFDSANQEILIGKLSHYGIRKTKDNGFASHLSKLSQFVSILGHDSETNHVPHGVLQGSVLGTLLFLIHINTASAFAEIEKTE